MARVLMRKDFMRWQAAARLPDVALCQAVQEIEAGLIDADLGGGLVKKRIARPGAGKRGGFRVVLAARIGIRYVFLHGFPKNVKENISADEHAVLRAAGKVILRLSDAELTIAVQAGVLWEVHCEQAH